MALRQAAPSLKNLELSLSTSASAHAVGERGQDDEL